MKYSRHVPRRASCLLIMSLAMTFTAAADPLALGVLEQPQCEKEQQTSARLLFAKSGGRWVSLDREHEFTKSLNPGLPNWTIAFDSRSLGNVKLRDQNPSTPTLNDGFYARDKRYEPETIEKLPVVKNESKSFAGWCDAPTARPLVLVSQPNFTDPQKWKPFSPNPSYKQKLYVPVKLVIGRFNAYRCTGKDGEHSEPWEFKADDLVLYKSFRAASGKELVSIGIDKTKIGCELLTAPAWSGHWFLLDGKKIEFLDNEMELVDAGDYDGDGRSELLFWYSGYNRDGYQLIYDDLRQSVEYLWSYH